MTPASSIQSNRHTANSCWVGGCADTQINHVETLLSKTQRLRNCTEELIWKIAELFKCHALWGMDLISANADEVKKLTIKGYLAGDWTDYPSCKFAIQGLFHERVGLKHIEVFGAYFTTSSFSTSYTLYLLVLLQISRAFAPPSAPCALALVWGLADAPRDYRNTLKTTALFSLQLLPFISL